MWTPRRVLLLLAGTALFAAVYGAYAGALGWIDGLPQLPAKALARSDGTFRPPERPVLPTVQLLREAFGPGCEEENTTTYANQFTFKSGDSWVVVATGRVPNPDGKSVTLSPFSVAVFGKPKPPHLRAPGEVSEVSTFHADKAVLEFDRVVTGLADMVKAKVLRLELVSDPEATTADKRRGLVHITNNQRTSDPNRSLVVRTPGPVFYRDPKNADRKAAGPDVWTDAAIEVVDKQNLPRAYGAPAPPTATTRAKDLQDAGVVPDILSGRRFPPPTVTAVGLKVFLEDKDAKLVAVKKGSAGFSGVRRLELGEKVLLNLWVDARQSVMASPGGATSPLSVVEEPPAAAAVVGGLFAAVQSVRRLDRALLQIETLGPFAYDAEKNVGRFDVVPAAEAGVQDYVQVHKLPPRGGTQRLFSQVLEIEFNGPPTGGKAPEPKAAGAGPSFKELRAWTYTPGRLVMVSSDADRLNAFGTKLVHDETSNKSVLTGAPLTAIRGNEARADKKEAGESVLTAGAAGRPATLTMTSTTTGAKKSTAALIEGAGTMKLFDPNSGTQSVEAAWAQSMSHTRETAQNRELDLLTFTGAASFDDRKADFWLKGNVLKLWLDPAAGQGGGQPLPHQVQALGDVSSHSTDYDIERADHLNVVFTEGVNTPTVRPAAPTPAAPAQPVTAQPNSPTPAPAVASAPQPKEEPRPKPPIRIRARLINTTVERVAFKNDFEGLDRPGTKMPGLSPSDPVSRTPTGGTKYQLKHVSCEGSDKVRGQDAPLVHQDPTDPGKQPRGIDIYGTSLHLDQTPDGAVMTVTGETGRPGQVHHEGMSVVGPKVVIDQLRNRLSVEGGGSLAMPVGSTLAGSEPQKAPVAAGKKDAPPAPPIVIHWRDEMRFEGALKTAEFIGRVRTIQGEASVVCHTMQVFFDKPVVFNPARPAGATPGPRGDAKIDRVYCYNAPGDAPDEPRDAHEVHYTEVQRDPTGRLTKWQFLRSASLEMTAKTADAPGQEPYQQLLATGPGEVRIWQYGEKNVSRAQPSTQPMTPPVRPAPAEGEMKLTVVKFAGRMVAKDKGRLYQEAEFFTEQNGSAPIEVVHAPASEPGAAIAPANPPVGTVTLRCAERLVVSTHRPEGQPAAQRMDAYGNVFIRSDEYDGWGEVVNSDGRYVTLSAAGNALARITHRFNGSGNIARRIVYDRATGDYRVTESAGATIQPPR
ncbi:hypothetical protein [Urbifossiella limnaea]|uniref:Organic solvent tolerance-like N-terminal domain-containing protein n=1 Tax=Urbifossiella limnaea TaxID=2528023 RepID=A0A517XTG2_9BACT|nr:hypothetical protein [Urbifossiella limnaea]QDU20785.1 hypothetical protein ETAA1_27460 [Urbifossiella limnaea]